MIQPADPPPNTHDVLHPMNSLAIDRGFGASAHRAASHLENFWPLKAKPATRADFAGETRCNSVPDAPHLRGRGAQYTGTNALKRVASTPTMKRRPVW